MEWIEIIMAITTLLLAAYHWSTSTFDFWKLRGVQGPPAIPLFGNLKEVIMGKYSLGQYLERIYNEFRHEQTIGIFLKRQPALLLVDPELIKDVLIKDFTIFADRGLKIFDMAEPLEGHLVNLESARWRPLRKKLSPVFTSGKVKKMFHHLLESGQHLEDYLDKLVLRDEAVECRELTAKFTTDVIGSCLFGLHLNALTDENSEIRQIGREIFTPDWKKILKIRLRDLTPWLYSLLGPLVIDSKLTKFFTKLTLDVLDYRKNNQIVKQDIIDLMMELRDNHDKIGDVELTDTFLAAQLFIFLLAGFEASSTAMSSALYELAQHQSIQDRLRMEINDELAKNDGKLTYDCVKSMKYLDMVFKETLRKYPPATILVRKPAEDYTFADTKLTIPKGTQIIISILGIHRDPQIYPKPEVFDPERFTEKAIKTRHPMNWLPFGNGPRNCIGFHFAYYQSKVGLIKILHRYKVQVCEKTRIPYVIDPHGLVLSPIDGINVKISKIV